ncbi:MAG: A24 family peptidase [Thermoguttaceae bacterium]
MDYASPTAFAAVAVIVAIAGAIDVRHFKVPNVLTGPLLICGLAYHTISGGPAGLQSSLFGALFGFGVLIGLYVLGAMGAGDVKLMTGVGAWLGASATVYVFAVAAAATGLYSLVVLIRHGRLGHAVATIQVTLFQFKTLAKHLGANQRVESVVKQEDRRQRLIPFAAMIALGVVVVLVWHQLG